MLRKFLLTTAACAAFAFTGNAQQYFSIGPVISFGHSAITNGDLKDSDPDAQLSSKFNPSFSAGIGLIYAKHAHWGFGGEVLYSQEGFKKNFVYNFPGSTTALDFDATSTIGYIRVPLRVYYFFGQYQQKVRPKVYLGPSFGFKIAEKNELEGNNEATKELLKHNSTPLSDNEINGFDAGLQAGAGVNITLSKAIWLNVDANYYQGFLDVLKDESTGTNWNQHLRLQVGVLFGLGSLSK